MNARAWTKHELEATHHALRADMEKLSQLHDSHIVWHENLKPVVDGAFAKIERLQAEFETSPNGALSEEIEAHFQEFGDDVVGFDWLEDAMGRESAKIANLMCALLRSVYFHGFLLSRQLTQFEQGLTQAALARVFVMLPNIKIRPLPLDCRPTIQPNAPAL
jgi:hypothetical protein